jgi:hypothetical protein
MEKLIDNDFAALFGTDAIKVRKTSGAIIDAINLDYRVIEGSERDAILLSVLKRIHLPELTNAGDNREGDWELGWRENLLEFIQYGYDLEKLIPKYYKDNVIICLNRQYILPSQPDFVYQYTKIFRAWLFREYLTDYEVVFEFGCGTGHNLVHLAELYPDKTLYGFDWTRSSQEIIQIVADQFGMKIKGGFFNFFDPDETLTFDPDSAVFTFGALEQLGPNHNRYLDFILKRKPKLCVDVIGIHELYDETQLFDYLALLYHMRRNYLNCYLTRLRELEASGTVEIVKVQHHLFGNLYDNPYSYVIWKPIHT